MTVDPWSTPAPVPERHQPAPPPERAGGWEIGRKHRLLDMVAAACADDPRSAQRHMGPSEVGSPCNRKLALHSLDAPQRDTGVGWEAARGTGVHMWLAQQVGRVARKGELLLEVGLHVDGDPDDDVDKLAGSSDVVGLWDLPGGDIEVVDWKIVGPTTLKKVNAGRIGEGYHVQVQVYGLGVKRTLGLTPSRVTIIYMPVAGSWHDARVVSRPYDEQVALAAIDRWHAIRARAREVGLEVVARSAPTADDFCQSCPYMGTTVGVVVNGEGPGLVLCRGHAAESKAAGS